ncbi:MAG: hypothetical protein RLP44_23625 [Aggregatilineales bacterium]
MIRGLLTRLTLLLTTGFVALIAIMPFLAPSTQIFAYSDDDLWVHDVRHHISHRIGTDLLGFNAWTWSPDGTKIGVLVTRDGIPMFQIIDLQGGEMRWLTVRAGQFPVWSPDGAHIVYAATDAEGIYIVNIADGSLMRHAVGVLAREIVWLPDSRGLVLTGWSLTQERNVNPNAYLIQLGDPTLRFLYEGVQRTRISPDGSRLALVSSRRNALEILSLENTDDPSLELARSNGSVRHLIWSPDNRQLIYEVAFTNLSSLLVVDIADGLARTLVNDVSEYASYAAWSPDGQKFAFYSQLESGETQLTIQNNTLTRNVPVSLSTGFTWSPDSRFLLVSTSTRFIIVDAINGDVETIPARSNHLPMWQP